MTANVLSLRQSSLREFPKNVSKQHWLVDGD